MRHFALKKNVKLSSKTLVTTYRRSTTTQTARIDKKKSGQKLWLMKYDETGMNGVVP
jgi:hypothetical protein